MMGKKHKLFLSFKVRQKLSKIGHSVLIVALLLSLSWISFATGVNYTSIRDSKENLLGTYTPATKIIVLYTNRQGIQDLDITYLHERCHKVWHEELNILERVKYNKIYNNATYFVSYYSKISASEDFAESCSVYITDIDKVDIKRKEFLDSIDKNILIPVGYK